MVVVRHRERVVGEVDLLLLLVPLVHREIDDPAEGEAVLVDEVELAADLAAARRRQRREASPGWPQTKKTASPSPSFSRSRIASVRSGPMFLAIGPAPSPSSRKKM